MVFINRLYRYACIARRQGDSPEQILEMLAADEGIVVGDPKTRSKEAFLKRVSKYRGQWGPHPLNDIGNAERLRESLDEFSDGWGYCPPLKAWFKFDLGRWVRDDSLEIETCAREVVEEIGSEAEDAPHLALEIRKWALRSGSAAHVRAMIALARSMLAAPWLVHEELRGKRNPTGDEIAMAGGAR